MLAAIRVLGLVAMVFVVVATRNDAVSPETGQPEAFVRSGNSQSASPSTLSTASTATNQPPQTSAPPAPPAPETRDPVELTRRSLEALEKQLELVSRVGDVASAPAAAAEFSQAERYQRRLEATLGRQLITPEQQSQIDNFYKERKQRLAEKWHTEQGRVRDLPGVWANLFPELQSLADTTPLPGELAQLKSETARLMVRALELMRTVNDVPSALKVSPGYRVVIDRWGVAQFKVRQTLGAARDSEPAEITGMRRDHEAERNRIAQIPGALDALVHGERPPMAPAAPAVVARGDDAKAQAFRYPVPPTFAGYFQRFPDAVLVLLEGMKDPSDEQRIGELLAARNPSIRDGFGTPGKSAMAPVPDLERFLRTIDFAEVQVDRQSRVVLLRVRYPLPKPSQWVAERQLEGLRSGDIQRVRESIRELSRVQPGPGRELVGEELLKLMAFDQARSDALGMLVKGWFGKEQIPQVKQLISQTRDRGEAFTLAEGISRLPDPEAETIRYLANLFEVSPFHARACMVNIGPACEGVVQESTTHAAAEVRRTACDILGAVGSDASLPVLQARLQDPDNSVAGAARSAIEQIGKPIEQRPELFLRPND